MIYVGIDPGLSGAMAFLGDLGDFIACVDMPTLSVGKKRELHAREIINALNIYGQVDLGRAIVGLELVHAMPGQGVTSMFSMGRGLGLIQGILFALNVPFHNITPQRWKKTMMDGMPKEKDASRLRAQQIFLDADLKLKKHHGRADALLIAEYLRRTVR